MIASVDLDPRATEPPGLFAMLAARARRASDGVLAALTGIGGVAAIALAAVRPSWWPFALPLVSVGAFGLWGMLERATAERGAERSARYDRVVSAAQWIAVAIGVLCAIVGALMALGVLIGPFNN
ncbi:MAG TPA: hypothetical protein VGO46_19350 [Gemmatimonadaceae bacterium]|jgi:hypothetical protein|nr:hypothetical protein [Gemmatimonadaceae bacterium]